MDRATKPYVVYGAYGHTGRFVTIELRERGHSLILSGRDEHRLHAMAEADSDSVRPARLEDPVALDRALAGAAAVINCAGPFLDTAEPLIAAALRAGIPYVDVTAEQGSVLATVERFDAPAREAGVAVLPGMAFWGSLGDLLASAAMGNWPDADEIRIATALDSWRPTSGTRETGRRNTATRLVVRQGGLQAIDNPPAQTTWAFPPPFGAQPVVEMPFTESVLIARHLKVKEVRNYLMTKPLEELRDPATPAPDAVDEKGRSSQAFLMECHVRRGGSSRQARVQGRDIYATSAPLVAEAVKRLVTNERGGVFAPGEILDAADLLNSLSGNALRFELSSATD